MCSDFIINSKALHICWDWTLKGLWTHTDVTSDVLKRFTVYVQIAGNIAVYPCTGVNVAQSLVVSELV